MAYDSGEGKCLRPGGRLPAGRQESSPISTWGGGACFARCPGRRPRQGARGGSPLGRMGLARCLPQGAGWRGSPYLYKVKLQRPDIVKQTVSFRDYNDAVSEA